MKLLEKSELGGIDSTSKTIEKWDAFLKKAVPNLGFRQETVDGMYPYEDGIPLMDGGTMPVDDLTGRRFFKLSWADKLCGALSTVSTSTGQGRAYSIRVYKTLAITALLANRNALDAVMGDETFSDEVLDDLRSVIQEISYISTLIDFLDKEEICQLWKNFVEKSDIMICSAHLGRTGSSTFPETRTATDEEKASIANGDRVDSLGISGTALFFYCNALEEVFNPFPRDEVRRIANVFDALSVESKLRGFDEVYYQDYLCISLNPVDKFMCSTKQAFGSCMSIAKQSDTRGTNSTHAFGLPALFPCSASYLVFLTPGKHKNMYWESEQWEKEPDKRDPEKAYKYLKMTCRALTYKGVPTLECGKLFNNITELGENVPEDVEEAVERLSQEKLYVGRQYSACGEDYTWQSMIEFLLAKQGVSTPLGYVDDLVKIKRWVSELSYDEKRVLRSGVADNVFHFDFHDFVRRGTLTDKRIVTTDRFGYIRGIYYDNIQLQLMDNAGNGIYTEVYPQKDDKPVTIATGCSRFGSGAVSYAYIQPNLDMFKMMLGEQNYTYFNKFVKICSRCGELLTGDYSSTQTPSGDHYCAKCAEELELKQCRICNYWYTKDEASDHEVFDLCQELGIPNKEHMICKYQLRRRTETREVLCAHCGTWYRAYYVGSGLNEHTTREIKGIEVRLSLCGECLAKSVMCDKCKRVLFLEDTKDACLLLPNRRVVCPDCLDSIRLKQVTRESLQALFKNLKNEDVETDPADLEMNDILNHVARDMEARGKQIGYKNTLIKDVYKQVKSYLQAHPDEDFPKVRMTFSEAPQEDHSDEIEEIPY